MALFQSSSTASGLSALLATIWGVIVSPFPLLIALTIFFSICILTYAMITSEKDFCWSRWNAYTFGSLFGYGLVILLGTAGVITGTSMTWLYGLVMAAVAFAGTQMLYDYDKAPRWLDSVQRGITRFKALFGGREDDRPNHE